MSEPRKCAINDCDEPAAGLMEWPYIHTVIQLCQRHADFVGAIERTMTDPAAMSAAASRIEEAMNG